jgi:hypothetical protein
MKSIKNYRIDLANEGWNENSSEAFCASLPSIIRALDSSGHGVAHRRPLLDGFHLIPTLGNRFCRNAEGFRVINEMHGFIILGRREFV